MADPRIPALPFQIIVVVEGAPFPVSIHPATFDEVQIDDVDHLIAATVNTVELTLRDAIAERAKPSTTPPVLRLDPATCTLVDVARALLEDLPEMATDEPLNGGDAVDVLCSVWPAMLAALARELPQPAKPRKRVRVTSSVTVFVDDESTADAAVRAALAPLVDGYKSAVVIEEIDEVDRDGNVVGEDDD